MLNDLNLLKTLQNSNLKFFTKYNYSIQLYTLERTRLRYTRQRYELSISEANWCFVKKEINKKIKNNFKKKC